MRNIPWYKPGYQKTTNWYASVPQNPILSYGAQKYPTPKIESICTSSGCTIGLIRFGASQGQLRLLRQSNCGRKRLHTLNLELIQHHPCTETRFSPYTQPLFSCPHGHNSRPSHLQPSQTQPLPPRQASPFTSRLGKRPSLVFSNADSNKKKQKQSSLSFPSTRPLHGITLNIRGMTPERTSTCLRPSTLSS